MTKQPTSGHQIQVVWQVQQAMDAQLEKLRRKDLENQECPHLRYTNCETSYLKL